MANEKVQKIFNDVYLTTEKVITEELAKQVLTEYGVKVPKYALVKSADEAGKQAQAVGFPLVAKIVSPQILHKTDVKGVKIGLQNEAAARETFIDMHGRLSKQYNVKGVLLEKMAASGGIELIVGLQNDPQFGPVIMAGIGGIYTEVFKDVSFRILPITKEDAISMIEDLKGNKILKGFRGMPSINMDMLATALVDISKFGTEMAPYYESVDFNPVIFYENDYVVVDAKILLRDKPDLQIISKAQPDSEYMDLFFNAKSIALIGASPEAGKVGNSVLESMVKHDYKGRVFPVNATKKGIHNFVVISGGGKELGGERAAIEAQIKELSKQLHIRIIGPNCIGMFNGENRLDCAFQGHARMLRPKNGNVAFLSQSGTVGIAFMESADTFGMSKMISYGNRSDVDEADMIWYLSEDPQTRVVGLYVEGFGDGRKFMNTARKVIKERRKPIVVFKNGRTTRGAKQAASHTGSLGGSYGVVKGALDQAGIISVDSYEELTAALKALTWQPVPNGGRVAMVTNGAGPIIAAIDQFERLGLQMAELTEQSKKSLMDHYPPTYVIQSGNPCDITGSANADDYRFAIQTFMDDPNVDIVMPWFVFQDDPLEETIVDVLASFQKQRKKPILIGAMGGPFTKKISERIEDANVPVYFSVTEWVTAAGAIAKWTKVSGKAK
ncbi:MAG: acyl-CoA synthetase [Thaumarchaeota archaeon]|nr:MAG: acyl-CoA synthetase [Nitrososphaerota archaeon]